MVIADARSELTRFAGNEIHQSVAERFRHIRVRLIDGGRIGVGEVRGHGERAVALRVRRGRGEPARHHRVRRVTAAASDAGGGDDAVAFAEATAAATPQDRAELVVDHHRRRRRARPQRVRRAEHDDDHHRDRHERGAAPGRDLDAGEPRVGRSWRRRRWLRVAPFRRHRRARRRRTRGRGRGHVRAQPERDGDRPRRLRGRALAVRGDRPARTPLAGWASARSRCRSTAASCASASSS